MDKKRTVLIVTDGSEKTGEMAARIAAALKGDKVTIKGASGLKGNDLLPADAFFLGSEKADPESYAYLSDFFLHVNLAGRPCGVFSSGTEKAAKYLSGLVKDSEAALNPEPYVAGSKKDIGRWAKNTISDSR